MACAELGHRWESTKRALWLVEAEDGKWCRKSNRRWAKSRWDTEKGCGRWPHWSVQRHSLISRYPNNYLMSYFLMPLNADAQDRSLDILMPTSWVAKIVSTTQLHHFAANSLRFIALQPSRRKLENSMHPLVHWGPGNEFASHPTRPYTWKSWSLTRPQSPSKTVDRSREFSNLHGLFWCNFGWRSYMKSQTR